MKNDSDSARHIWQEALRTRLHRVLSRLANGDDPTPALRLKAEGFAEAGLALGFTDAPALAELLDQAYLETFGERVDALFPFAAADCVNVDECRFIMPVRMRRAPVRSGGAIAQS